MAPGGRGFPYPFLKKYQILVLIFEQYSIYRDSTEPNKPSRTCSSKKVLKYLRTALPLHPNMQGRGVAFQINLGNWNRMQQNNCPQYIVKGKRIESILRCTLPSRS
ncbi:hypothetical protein CEXT_144811 [Caerostris extrusa]|uniref:Uncharacterized protein n=1 Tax=Caerostris extrusa TaxID=172846 RepID=A0AAV4WZR2_CAEEX|nr:hypothetical protein CEXT_144811 [Caerostris extrusa]